jgi:hypothetical protein
MRGVRTPVDDRAALPEPLTITRPVSDVNFVSSALSQSLSAHEREYVRRSPSEQLRTRCHPRVPSNFGLIQNLSESQGMSDQWTQNRTVWCSDASQPRAEPTVGSQPHPRADPRGVLRFRVRASRQCRLDGSGQQQTCACRRSITLCSRLIRIQPLSLVHLSDRGS